MKDTPKDISKQIRIGDKEVKILEYLRRENVVENDSEGFRHGIRAAKYCHDHGIEVPA